MELIKTSKKDDYILTHNNQEYGVIYHDEYRSDDSIAYDLYCDYSVDFSSISRKQVTLRTNELEPGVYEIRIQGKVWDLSHNIAELDHREEFTVN